VSYRSEVEVLLVVLRRLRRVDLLGLLLGLDGPFEVAAPVGAHCARHVLDVVTIWVVAHLGLLGLVDPRRPVDEHVGHLFADGQLVPVRPPVFGFRNLQLHAAARLPPSALRGVNSVE